MQLTKIKILLPACFCVLLAKAQQDTSKINLDDIETTFLSSYYQQDGNHSAVTGGQGTEKLTNIAPAFIVNIPLDTTKSLSFNGGVDFYSSASSDNINNPYLNPHHISGASSGDTRVNLNTEYKRKNNLKNSSNSYLAGLSVEFDVISMLIGGAYSKSSNDNNKEISLKAKYYYDDWKLIYPVELRNGTVRYLNTDKRHSFIFSATGSANINRRLAASLTADLVLQSGMLSTPFHRVYFQYSDIAVVEQLPSSRLKVPVGLRINYYITDFLIFRTFYRFYKDSWEITGNTIKTELPIRFSRYFRIFPFYRFHTQSAAKYFAPYQVHSGIEEFFTSDYDLSALQTHKAGIGISFSPVFGIVRYRSLFKKNGTTLLSRSLSSQF